MTITHWIISALAIGIAAFLIPGIHVTIIGALVLAVVLGLINAYVKPLVVLLTLPLTILTLGLFLLVLNAAFILLAAYIIPDPHFSVDGFLPALLFSIVISLVSALFGNAQKKI
jgi:putative membrane protein